MSKVPYESAIRLLMYAITYTRPVLAQTVSSNKQVSIKSRMVSLGCSQVNIQILEGDIDYDITFSRQYSNALIVGYIVIDYAMGLDDKRSTTCYLFTFCKVPICWKSML